MNGPSRFFLLLIVAWLGGALAAAPLRGEGIVTIPPFMDALPLADSEKGVQVTASFLANPTTVVPAGSTMRMFYVRPAVFEKDAKIVGSDATRQQAYSRQPADAPEAVYVSSQLQAMLKTVKVTVWPNIASFRAALDMIDNTDLRLVYQTPTGADLSDEAFNFVEGLLLGEKDNVVTILGVVKGSSADHGGILPGDRIDRFNDTDLKGSLATFQQRYADVRATAKISSQKPYTFVLRHPGSETPVTVMLHPPPSLGGSLMDQ